MQSKAGGLFSTVAKQMGQRGDGNSTDAADSENLPFVCRQVEMSKRTNLAVDGGESCQGFGNDWTLPSQAGFQQKGIAYVQKQRITATT